MPREKPLEIITPPNVLKVKVGGGIGPLQIDPSVLDRADKALTNLRKDFAVWLDEQAKSLAHARDQLWASDGDGKALSDMLRWSIEIKGQGATMSFPFVTRVASSLERLIQGTKQLKRPLLRSLVDAHVDAIVAAIRDSVTDPNDKVATALATQLESHVAATIKP
jgi:chemotaxis protein histidine kinase CheA